MKKYRCISCRTIIPEQYVKEDLNGNHICPECGCGVEETCPLDHGGCNHVIVPGISICPECGEYICPECGAHDVSPISRITGYLQDVNSWNAAKRRELVDRTKSVLV